MIRAAIDSDFRSIDTFDIFAGDRQREIREARMIVFERGDEILGYLSWVPAGFVGRDYITYLCVRPDARREGIASQLVEAAEKQFAGARLFISTDDDNDGMLSFLGRKGWTNAGAVEGANDGNRAEVFFYKDL